VQVIERLPRGRALALLRYTLIIATAYLLLVEHEFSSPPTGLFLLILAALGSNVVMARLPARITDSTALYVGIILGDTLWITAVLLFSGLLRAEFFYLYLFVLLLAAIGESLALIAIGTVVVCAAYAYILSATGGVPSVWTPRLLIRIPFLFTAAAFYGYLVDRVRRERLRAREEARTVERLQEIQGRLAERAQEMERANQELANEIAERKRAEAALQAAKEYAETLINSSLDMIISVNADRNIVEFNRAAEEAFGYSKAEVLGKPVDLLYADPSDGSRVSGALFKHERFRGEIANRRKNGEIFYSYLSASMIRDASGNIVGGMGISRDITERKQAEESLRESNRRLEEALAELQATQQQVLQQERLRALGEMASGIAHDFNNALSPVVGFTEVLLDRPEYLDNREKVTRYLKMVNTAAQDAANVVRRLREFYRHRDEEEILLPINLNELVEQVIMLTQPRWKDQALAGGVTIRVETDLQNVARVTGNESELREVLTNLILNSADAMPEGGTITLRTRSDGTHVVLEVIDTGTGMTEEVRQRCLEPFFTTKGKRGTGLGLAMVYGIIRRHQGTLSIESGPGRGTTVIIRLPVHRGPGARARAHEAKGSSRRLDLLVVDDEPAIREVVTEYLTADGHYVETATNGREGLEKFLAGRFDVVVTDQGMPEMSGDQLAGAIKRVAPNRPVILLTGFGDIMEAAGDQPVDVDTILTKPVTVSAMRQALAKVMGE
jgi:PAS domain S-box-containing protein